MIVAPSLSGHRKLLGRPEYGKYLLFSLGLTQSFVLPIRVTFMLTHGVNAAEIGSLRSIFSVAVALFDIPTSLIADHVPKKPFLLAGALFFSAHALVYLVSPSYLGFVIAQLCLAMSSALLSGVDSAYLHDLVKAHPDDSYADVRSSLDLHKRLVTTFLTFIASWVFLQSPVISFVTTTALGGMAMLAVLWLPGNGGAVRKNGGSRAKAAWVETMRNPAARGFVLMASLLATCLIFNFEMYQVIFPEAGIPAVLVGPIYASFGILMALGGRAGARFEGRGPRAAFYVCVLLASCSFVVVAFSRQLWPLVLVAIVLQQLTFGALGLVIDNYLVLLGDRIDAKSTVLSLQSTITNVVKAGLVLLLSALVGLAGLGAMYVTMAVGLAVSAALLIRGHRDALGPIPVDACNPQSPEVVGSGQA